MEPSIFFNNLSTDFTVFDAFEAPALCVPRLRRQRSAWTLLERPWGKETLYYLLHKEKLLELLLNDENETVRPLIEILQLNEDESNGKSQNGRQYHPLFGSEIAKGAKFAKGLIRIEADAPTGILFPSAKPVKTRGGGFEGTRGGQGTRGGGQDEELVDCTVGAEFPEQLAVGDVVDLTITLHAGVVEAGGEQTTVPLSLDDGVIIRLSLSNNLQLVDKKLQKQVTAAPKDADHPVVLVYELKALTAAPAQIIVRLFQRTQGAKQIGFLELRPRVVATDPAEGEIEVAVQAYAPSRCPDPDLTVYVEEHDLGVKTEVRFRISDNEREWQPCGSKELPLGAHDFFRHEFSVIEGRPFYSDRDAQVIDLELRNKGANLHRELLSAEMREVFRESGNRIKSVQIKTNGHHIPWEMIRLPKIGDAAPEQYLAQRYQVTRWAEGFRAPARINIGRLLYTAPNYGDGARLKFVSDEVDFLRSLANSGVTSQRVPAETLAIRGAMEGQFGVFHYVGHAHASSHRNGEPELELDVETRQIGDTMKKIPQILNPTHVSNLSAYWQQCRPLVFLNACQTGQANISVSGLSGWANRLLESRAGAFVGALWSIRDSAANLFAKTFYSELLAGGSFGASAQRARQQVADTGDPSWLAYVVYAHPNTKVETKTS